MKCIDLPRSHTALTFLRSHFYLHLIVVTFQDHTAFNFQFSSTFLRTSRRLRTALNVRAGTLSVIFLNRKLGIAKTYRRVKPFGPVLPEEWCLLRVSKTPWPYTRSWDQCTFCICAFPVRGHKAPFRRIPGI